MYQFRIGKISAKVESTTGLAAAVALCIALLGIASASILIVMAAQEIGSNAITGDRLAVAAIAFALWNGFRRDRSEASPAPPYTRRAVGLFLVAGISFAASLTLWAWSLTQTSVANSTLLNNMMPIFTTLGGWLLFGQRFQAKFLLGMAVALVGAIAIGLEDLHGGNIAGDLAALLAAAFSATSILSLEQLRVQFPTPIIMLWTCAIGSVVVLPVALLTEDQLFPTSGGVWLAIFALGIISQAIGQGLLTYSLANYSSSFVAVSMLAIPVIAAVLAALIFSEQLSLFNWIAFAVVLIGIYLAVSARDVQATSN